MTVFHKFFPFFASDGYSYFICFLYLSVHVQAPISIRRANGGHAYYTVKTNEKSTFSTFYVCNAFVSRTEFSAFLFHVLLSKSLTFLQARFNFFGFIFGAILNDFAINLASKISRRPSRRHSKKTSNFDTHFY